MQFQLSQQEQIPETDEAAIFETAFVPASVVSPKTRPEARTVHPAQLPASIPAWRASGAAQASAARQAGPGSRRRRLRATGAG